MVSIALSIRSSERWRFRDSGLRKLSCVVESEGGDSGKVLPWLNRGVPFSFRVWRDQLQNVHYQSQF